MQYPETLATKKNKAKNTTQKPNEKHGRHYQTEGEHQRVLVTGKQFM